MDPQARRFLAMVAVGASDAGQVSAEARRRSFEQLMRFSQPPVGDVATTDLTSPGCGGDTTPLRVYAPAGAGPLLPGLVYFHGGGLVAGSLATHDALCRSLAQGSGCRVVAVAYRLAPEHPFPAPIIDALVATRWVLRHAAHLGLVVDSIGVGGDSGGATLAAIVCQVLRGRARIKAQVLLCPVLDFAGAHASRETFASGFLLDAATMARDIVHYAPYRALFDPRVSPLRAPSLAGLPRTIIHTAGFDPLRDEGAAYARRLEENGVSVDHTCHESLIHHFYGLTRVVPAAAVALDAIAADIARVLGT